MPRWYPVSISGYHIGEAGSTPVQQAAYTLSNGFAYAEMLSARGVPVDQFASRLSFFLDCGLDVEYIALARVSRKIWAIGMGDVFGANARLRKRFSMNFVRSNRSAVCLLRWRIAISAVRSKMLPTVTSNKFMTERVRLSD